MQHLSALPAPCTAFRLQTAAGQVTAHAGWLQARAAVRAAVDAGGAAVLLGPPGSGKSLLLQDLAGVLRQRSAVACLPRGDLVEGAFASGILLVDEADGLGTDALAALCAGPRPFVLAALPGFEARLAGLGRAVVPVPLAPLSTVDVARLVAERLDAAGQKRNQLEPDAVLALARLSGGVPRLVLVLAGSASFLAQCDGSPAVGRRHVEEAAALRAELDEETVPRMPEPVPAPPAASVAITSSVWVAGPRRRPAIAGAVMAGLGLVVAGGWAVQGQDRPVSELPRPTVVAEPQPGVIEQASGRPDPERQAQGGQALSGRTTGGQAPDLKPWGAPALDAAGPAVRAPATAAAVPAPARIHAAAPAPAVARPALETVLFQGPIFNETMNQHGHLTLLLRPRDAPGTVTARFSAASGLSGSGDLTGRLSGGHLDLSGQLMMGRNPFLCDLSGTLADGRLTGTASFVRRGGDGSAAHSRFSLTRS